VAEAEVAELGHLSHFLYPRTDRLRTTTFERIDTRISGNGSQYRSQEINEPMTYNTKGVETILRMLEGDTAAATARASAIGGYPYVQSDAVQ
jgi:hypothetical protein